MEEAGLIYLPTELIHYLCLFLAEDDIIALSYTCIYLNKATNDNRVWNRFVTAHVRQVDRVLKNQQWQRNPPLKPDMCEARQLLVRSRLLNNWRQNKGEVRNCCSHEMERVDNVLFYKEDFMLVRSSDRIYLWNISNTPVLESTSYLPKVETVFLIEDNLVIVLKRSCIVDVRKVDLKGRSLLHVYSFSIVEKEVDPGPSPGLVCEHPSHKALLSYQRGSEAVKVNDLLVFIAKYSEHPSVYLHIWDIVNARKVGEFICPRETEHTLLHPAQDGKLFVECNIQEMRHFFTFNISTQKFSEAIFTLPQDDWHTLSLFQFYNNHCIRFLPSQSRKTIQCEVYDLESNTMMRERHFNNVYSKFFEFLRIVVVLGKFIIPCLGLEWPGYRGLSFHVIDILSLETDFAVPLLSPSVESIQPVSIFGSIFLVTVEDDSHVRVWDLDERKAFCVLQPNGFTFEKKLGFNIYSSECMSSNITWLEDESTYHLRTKFVTIGKKEVNVVHFWGSGPDKDIWR